MCISMCTVPMDVIGRMLTHTFLRPLAHGWEHVSRLPWSMSLPRRGHVYVVVLGAGGDSGWKRIIGVGSCL